VLSHKSLFRRKIFIGAASLIVILFAVISFNHSDIFISRLPFWKSAVADSPHSSSAHNTLGVRYLEYDLSHLAEDEFSKSIKLSPGNINALINLSIISQYKNDYEKADRLLAMAMRLKPSEYLTWFNLGLLRYSQGNDKEAVDCWNKTLDINPNYYYGYRTLAGYYFLHGDAQAQKYLKICQYQFNRPVNIPATAALQGRNRQF
jgi:tetratricopeptide (TPR) repeat protein